MHRSLWLSLAICVSGLLAACGGGTGNNIEGGGGSGSQLATTHFSVTTPQDATVGAVRRDPEARLSGLIMIGTSPRFIWN